jgi:hypothetical protein
MTRVRVRVHEYRVTQTLAEIEDKLSVRTAGLRNLICQSGGWNMKAYKLFLVGILFLVAVSTMQAQSSLPDPHNDSCWSSLAALRACQLEAYNQAQDYQQYYQSHCTSYPEYQCNDYYEPSQKTVAKSSKDVAVPANNAQTSSANSGGGSEANLNAVTSTK